jgi:hypothetical protein
VKEKRRNGAGNILKEAVKGAVGATIPEQVQEVVAKETRRALREREDEVTTLVRTAVVSAIAEMLNGREMPSSGGNEE